MPYKSIKPLNLLINLNRSRRRKFVKSFALLFALAIALVNPVRAEVTIDDITIYNSQNPGQIWVTWTNSHWILGVSSSADGPILNAPSSSVSGVSQGQYWLFADPADLGTFPRPNINLSDGTSRSALFQVTGLSGSGESWTRLEGDTDLSLGWATGSIDLVGQYGGITPNGIADLYMVAQLGVAPIPEPSQYMLLLIGLALVGTMTMHSRKRGSDMSGDA